MNLSALTQKIGPFPAWAWGGLAIAGVWFFFLRGKTAGPAAAPNAAAAGSQLSSGYGLGYAQGLQAAQAGQPAQAAGVASSSASSTTTPSFQQWLQQAFNGQRPDLASGVQQGRYLDVLYEYAAETAAAEQRGARPGVGGPKSIGSRSANLWHHSHPLIGARVPYQYHVRAVGGAPNHAREVHRVALQAGVHPARLMALNPTPTGYIRVA